MIDVLTAYFATNNGTAITGLGTTHTGRPGDFRQVLAIIIMEGTGDSVSTCTYAGGAMRFRAGVTTSPTGNRIEIWELSDLEDGYSSIPVAANAVSIVFSDQTSGWVGVIQINGMSTVLDTSGTNNIENGTQYMVVPEVEKEDSLALSCFVGGSAAGTITFNTGQTTIYNNQSVASMAIAVGYKIEDRGYKTQMVTCSTAVNRGIYHVRVYNTAPIPTLAQFA